MDRKLPASKIGLESEPRWSDRLAPVVTAATRQLVQTVPGGRNRSRVSPSLSLEHWPAVSDGLHNLTTDLAWWRDHFYLVHSSSPWHIASSRSRILLWRSRDARHWEQAGEFRLDSRRNGNDIRDPKLAVIGDRLFLYVLRNEGMVAEPCGTSVTWTEDGARWAPLRECEPNGWLFWRPKTRDGKTWYVPAYWHRHGKSMLLTSADGLAWEAVGEIYRGDHNDETDIEFLADGRLMATARLEMSGSLFGHSKACTLVAVAKPPFTQWSYTKCQVTRLDGPNLFSLGGMIFAAGRHHPDCNRSFNRRGSFLGRKRTSLYRVSSEGLIHLSDLPSAGDTGYPGVVIRGDSVYLCYYTNDIERDYRWLPGMFLPSEIRLAKFPVAQLLRLAEGA